MPELPIEKKEITTKIDKLPVELKKVVTDAINNRLIFPNSEKVIGDIGILYTLNKKSSQITFSISSKFLVSLFALEFLNVLGNIIKNKYNIQLTLEDFKNSERLDQIKMKISELKNETVIDWSTECLENLKDVIDNINVDNLDRLMTLGHVINLTEEELLRVADKIESIEIYDILYRYLNRLNNLKLKAINSENIKKMEFKFEEIEKEKDITKYRCTNFICELR